MSRRTGILIAIMALAAGLAGCARPTNTAPGGPPPTEDTARMRQQAQDALARWDAAVKAAGGNTAYIPIRGQSFISDWTASEGEKFKGPVTTGHVEIVGVDPGLTMPPAKITWEDGTSLDVKTVTVGEALATFKAESGQCGGCKEETVVQLTSATPTTIQVQTTRGMATVPAWKFTIADSTAWVGQGAVMPSLRLEELAWDSNNPPAGTSIEKAAVEPGGRRLRVTLPGSPGTSREPCGADYTAEAVESATAVVVIVHSVSYADTYPGAGTQVCPAIGAFRETTVDLAGPLGDRAVLEVRMGQPVPVT